MSRSGPSSKVAPRPEGSPRGESSQEAPGARETPAQVSMRVRVVRSAPGEYIAKFTPLDESADSVGIGQGILDLVTDLLMEEAREEEEGHGEKG